VMVANGVIMHLTQGDGSPTMVGVMAFPLFFEPFSLGHARCPG
jgi:hypothetical protein